MIYYFLVSCFSKSFFFSGHCLPLLDSDSEEMTAKRGRERCNKSSRPDSTRDVASHSQHLNPKATGMPHNILLLFDLCESKLNILKAVGQNKTRNLKMSPLLSGSAADIYYSGQSTFPSHVEKTHSACEIVVSGSNTQSSGERILFADS